MQANGALQLSQHCNMVENIWGNMAIQEHDTTADKRQTRAKKENSIKDK